MKLYLLERTKAEYTFKLICANFKTVLDAISGLDGTDETITVSYIEVADSYHPSNHTKIKQ